MPIHFRGIDGDTYDLATASSATTTNIVATSSATGTVVLTLGPFNVENGGTFAFEMFLPSLTKGTTNVDLELWDGTPGTGTLLTTLTGHLAANIASPGFYVVYVTLATGTHTLKVAGFVDAGTGVFNGGAGTTGALPAVRARVRPV
jgi:hypothetical protein